jgi:betaine lipid synthase
VVEACEATLYTCLLLLLLLSIVDPDFASFRSFIYGFTWEDPYVDMQHLSLGKDDSILCITSAGDNALHYAIAAEPQRIHCVDMNACQGHLLELKLACIAALEYDEFWSLFGAGRNKRFAELLESKISPYLSSHAYQFWRLNNHYFDKAFYFRGYTGHALRVAKLAFTLAGVRRHVDAFCSASTLQEQQSIWDKHLRSTMINRKMIQLFFRNPAFLWNALGVPMNQYNCFRDEGVSVEQYAIDTLDSMPSRALVSNENYHYKVCLQGSYSPQSCPLYLKPEGFKKLKQESARLLDTFRLHTNSIVNVLRGFQDGSLTRAITMDHMDWYDPVPDSRPAPSLTAARVDSDKSISDLDREIVELSRVIARGGIVFWRSAAKVPWYNQRFEKMGFKVEAIHIRETGKSIDCVNMYASFYKAIRV